MRPKSLLLLALALGCGLIASIGISQVMESNKQGPVSVEKVPIYIAKVRINTGDPINSEMVMLKEWPKADIPQGAIRELAELEDRRPRTPIFEGEPILEGKLLQKGETGADPTNHITKGFRIVPISVRADTGAAGLLRPGDRVDVQWYVARDPRKGVQETMTKTILHNVRVFAVDQAVTRAVGGQEAPTLAKTISLLLKPKEANKVQLAAKIGEVSLIPRNPDDPSAEDVAAVTFGDLLTGSEKGSREGEQRADSEQYESRIAQLVRQLADATRPSPTPAPSSPFEMELVIGSKVERVLFDPTSGKPLAQRAPAFGGGPGYGGNPTSTFGNSGLEEGELPISIDAPAPGGSGGGIVDPLDPDSADLLDDFPIDWESEEELLN